MLLALLMFIASLAFLMNDYRLSEPFPDDMQREKSWARSGPMPDIMISAIEVEPHVPRPGEPFTLHVFCQNIGIVPSGRYDLFVTVSDAKGNELYSDSSRNNGLLEPGQTGAAFSAGSMRFEDKGSYTISVVVDPDGFEDSNTENNRLSRVIAVE